MNKYYQIVLFFLFSIGLSGSSLADPEIKNGQENQPVILFPADIKDLISQEMLSVEKAMKGLVSSIATGNWQKTEVIGKQIQASYIMKKSLTAEQMKHLHHSLPAQFIKLDHSFHHFAGMLAHAAEAKNSELVNFYFYKMNESCVKCHSTYAVEKFSGFNIPAKHHHAD